MVDGCLAAVVIDSMRRMRDVLRMSMDAVCVICVYMLERSKDSSQPFRPDADDDSDINECSDFMFSDDESDSSPGRRDMLFQGSC